MVRDEEKSEDDGLAKVVVRIYITCNCFRFALYTILLYVR